MEAKFKMDTVRTSIVIASCVGMICVGTLAQAMGDAERQWQQNVLTSPTQQQIALEHKGHIVILDGLTDKIVEQVLNTQFERLGSLMFTRVVITDAKGKPKKDPETGQVMTEDDGC